MKLGKFELDKIYCGDCLELMKDIPDKSIDLVLTDPPYNMTICKWDKPINLGNLWKELLRIGKNNCVFIFTTSQLFTTDLINSNRRMFKEEIIWLKNKGASGFHWDKRHIKIHENILVFSKEKHIFNPQKWLVDKKEFLTQRKTLKEIEVGNIIYPKMIKKQKKDDGTRNPLSIVSCRVPFNPSKTKKYSEKIEIRLHPTQKPVALMEYLIKTYSNKNDLILDPFMGSGTTAVACIKLGRHFLGFEINPEYVEISRARLKAVKEIQDKLF